MSRRVINLVALVCAVSVLAGCASKVQVESAPTQAGSPTGPGAAATILPTADTSASASPTLPSPTEQLTMGPTQSSVPDVTYAPAPQPSIAPAAAGAPATPTGTGLTYPTDPCAPLNPDEGCGWLQVSWHEANPNDVSIRVYAVTACLHDATASHPYAACVVNGDTIPKADLVLLGAAPASAGSFRFPLAAAIGEGASPFGSLPGWGPEVQAIAIQAVNGKGGSALATVASSTGCYGCVL